MKDLVIKCRVSQVKASQKQSTTLILKALFYLIIKRVNDNRVADRRADIWSKSDQTGKKTEKSD